MDDLPEGLEDMELDDGGGDVGTFKLLSLLEETKNAAQQFAIGLLLRLI